MPLGKATRRILSKPKAAKSTRKVSAKRLIDTYYEAQNKKPDKGRKKGVVSPSGMTKCRRLQQFKLLCVPVGSVNIRPQMRRIWDNGHSSESRMRHALMEGAKMVGGSFSPKGVNMSVPEFLIAGEADGVLETPPDNKYIVDFKTRNRKGFEALLRPSREYVWQAHAYMKGLQIPQYIVYYENKDSQNHKEFFLRFSEKVWTEIREWTLDPLLNAMRNQYLVERDDHTTGKRKLCQGNECPYYGFCYSSDDLSFEEADNRPTPVRKKHLQVL